MVEMESLREKLQQIVGIPLTIKELNKQESGSFFNHNNKTVMDSVVNEGEVWFPLYSKNGRMSVMAGELNALSLEEVQFMELLVANMRDHTEVSLSSEDIEEREVQQFSDWLQSQIDLGELESEVPDRLTLKNRIQPDMVPFFLTYEGIHTSVISYIELKKLIVSYFDGEVVLIPLVAHEWLILACKELIVGAIDEKEDDVEESDTDILSAFCDGLYELIASESVGGIHLSVTLGMNPIYSLPSTVNLLRETVELGKVFRITEHIHLPWDLVLERLISSIPDTQQVSFLEQVGNDSIIFKDTETLSTLETFFQLDCNVSETAKRMYIHRNTLLYRLDKIKQETGLDVRSFGDAVLIKLTMLLYKVTKRK
ncbi:hypothetical protein J2T13_003924 [Paenibacillus sp. DS2015]|uniref:PucR family transcriptional regulator n=1 Tax=Paenibacillus sp. DS2015 TaxID=3373917 RepID=UPI003D234997